MNTRTANISEKSQHRVCPWWVAYLFDNPLRRMIHPAEKILGAYVTEGMTVLDFGCGFGHYALGMARLTGLSGQVFAVDVQQKMLDKTMPGLTKRVWKKLSVPCAVTAKVSARPPKWTLS